MWIRKSVRSSFSNLEIVPWQIRYPAEWTGDPCWSAALTVWYSQHLHHCSIPNTSVSVAFPSCWTMWHSQHLYSAAFPTPLHCGIPNTSTLPDSQHLYSLVMSWDWADLPSDARIIVHWAWLRQIKYDPLKFTADSNGGAKWLCLLELSSLL